MSEKLHNVDEIAAVCSDCGTCLFACPVYNAELTEPNSPRGKVNIIKALQDGRLKPGNANKEFLYRCALCGSCEHSCTKSVAFVDMMINFRGELAKGKKIPFLKKIMLYLYQSFIFRKFVWVVDILAKTPLQGKLGIPRRRKAKSKKLFTSWKENEGSKVECDILFFPGCVLTLFYPQIIEDAVKLLERKGYSVVVPKGLECCGFPFISQGWTQKFFKMREKNKEIFSKYAFKYLVVPCGTGVMTFRNYYGLDGSYEIHELTEFFYKYMKDVPVNTTFFKQAQINKRFSGGIASPAGPGGNLGYNDNNNQESNIFSDQTAPHTVGQKSPLVDEVKKITWHDPCHHLKSLGIDSAPRYFMKQFGENFSDDKSALCCGFGGIFSVGFPSTSGKILNRKKEKLDELGADIVVTACPGCYMQLRERMPGEKEVYFFTDIFKKGLQFL